MFWDVTPYSLIEIHSSFGRTFCPYHQNGKGGTFSPNLRYSYTELHGVTSHSAISPYSPRSEPQTSQLLSLVHLPLRQNMLSSSWFYHTDSYVGRQHTVWNCCSHKQRLPLPHNNTWHYQAATPHNYCHLKKEAGTEASYRGTAAWGGEVTVRATVGAGVAWVRNWEGNVGHADRL